MHILYVHTMIYILYKYYSDMFVYFLHSCVMRVI